MEIITGKVGKDHVSSADDRALHAAVCGTGNYVLNIGSQFKASVETSNNIIIADGDLLMNGTHARIAHGKSDTVIIENGTTGYNRIDLIVARYTKSSGLEDVQLVVIKGETTAGTPTRPSYTEGNVLEDVELAEMPLYAVQLSGVNVTSITPLFTVLTRQLSNLAFQADLEATNKAVSKAQTTANTAVTNAANAQATANQGVANASTAQSTADTANTKADSLANALGQTNSILATTQSIANSALTNADAAYKYAAHNGSRIDATRHNDAQEKQALQNVVTALGMVFACLLSVKSGGTITDAQMANISTYVNKINEYTGKIVEVPL